MWKACFDFGKSATETFTYSTQKFRDELVANESFLTLGYRFQGLLDLCERVKNTNFHLVICAVREMLVIKFMHSNRFKFQKLEPGLPNEFQILTKIIFKLGEQCTEYWGILKECIYVAPPV